MVDSTWFITLAILAMVAQGFTIFLALFEPTLRYKIVEPPTSPMDSEEFLRVLEAVSDSHVHDRTTVEVLTNGEVYYEAELEAIRKAKHSVNLEAYIFQRGEVTRRFLEALTERARAGVKVKVVLDAIGSFATTKGYCQELIDAGGQVCFYHPFRWHSLARINNRTHREIIVVDGEVGFLGGAGFADHWLLNTKDNPRWRDTMVRIEGKAVAALQSAFSENWLEASGELLAGEGYYPLCKADGNVRSMVVDSPPSAGRATRARMLFQILMATAQRQVLITTPYFLPDPSVRKELVKAMRERGVLVKIIVPGSHHDHVLTRRSSRRLYGELLEAGARIYEYRPSMIHTKTMVVDGQWSVVGSTNFDHRSFGLNDEVNLAGLDEGMARRLEQDFARDMADCKAVTLEEWQRRPITERVHEWMGALLERQQ